MNAKLIQRRLILDLQQRSFVIPNYTPKNWFEADVFEITKAGFFREYEIKLTRADFKADALKYSQTGNKHSLLAASTDNGPVEFYFVCPEGLIDQTEIPKWAGFYVATKAPRGVYVKKLIQAPRLHRKKVDREVEQHARGVCYWRYISMWTKKANLQG